MKASAWSDVHTYLRQHATQDIQVVYRRSKAARGPYRTTEMTLVTLFVLPGPEHRRHPARKIKGRCCRRSDSRSTRFAMVQSR